MLADIHTCMLRFTGSHKHTQLYTHTEQKERTHTQTFMSICLHAPIRHRLQYRHLLRSGFGVASVVLKGYEATA